MASISTCFTITAKQAAFFSWKPSTISYNNNNKSLHFHHHHHPSSSFQTSILLRNTCKFHKPRASVPVIRANFEFPVGIKPGNIVETDKLPTDVRKRAMGAVDSCGGRVTIGDVASKAGLKLNEAEKALQALAADTNGFLEVSDEGDVLYVFPRDYRMKLASKSFRLKIEPLLEKSKSAAEYVIRVSFGTALIASIVIVSTAIVVALSSRSDENNRDNRGRRGGRSFDPGLSFFFRPSDLFWYWDPYAYRRKRTRSDDDGMNFIESVFSFVFGDGDPNLGIEEDRWKLIGQYITSNGGVVTPEELAPYLDVPPMDETVNDESYILPVLLRFDGHPEVDEEGNILYRFPSLQRTAYSERSGRKEYVGKKWTEWVRGAENFFKEKKWQFSKAGNSEKAMVVGLGVLNLFGVIILGTVLKDTRIAPNSFLSFVSTIFPILQIYATSFFVIPLVRWFILRNTNVEIEKRNLARKQRARALELPDLPLRRKSIPNWPIERPIGNALMRYGSLFGRAAGLCRSFKERQYDFNLCEAMATWEQLLSARDMAKRTVIGRDRIVYSTDKDLTEQDYDAKEWDRRFKEIEKTD